MDFEVLNIRESTASGLPLGAFPETESSVCAAGSKQGCQPGTSFSEGVSPDAVTTLPERKKTGLEEALDGLKHGRVTEYKSVDDLFEKLGI